MMTEQLILPYGVSKVLQDMRSRNTEGNAVGVRTRRANRYVSLYAKSKLRVRERQNVKIHVTRNLLMQVNQT